MMKKIRIQNFRGIKEKAVTFSKLNILSAPNGSGKSSIIGAIRFALIGEVSDEDIMEGEKETIVEILFDSGTLCKRKRKEGVGACYVNEKKVSLKIYEETITKEMNTSMDVIKSVCGTDYLDGLNKKDLANFLLNIIPITVKKESMYTFLEETLKRKFSDSERKYVDTLLKNYETLNLNDICEIYKKVYDERKISKAHVSEYTEKSKFDINLLPPESKEQLEKEKEKLIISKAKLSSYKAGVRAYNYSVANKKKAEERKAFLEEELKKYADVEKPVADITLLENEKVQFLNAIQQTSNSVNSNILKLNELKETYSNLENAVCPLTRAYCTADLTPYKNNISSLGNECEKNINEGQSFIARCKEQVEKRDIEIKEFNEKNLLWTKKESLINELNNLVIPEIPMTLEDVEADKPEDTSVSYEELEKALNDKLLMYNASEISNKYKEMLENAITETEMLNTITDLFGLKGVRSTILKKALAPVQDIVNRNADYIKKGYKLILIDDEGMNVKIYPDGVTSVPLNRISSGEFILACYLIIGAIHDITGIDILIIDDIDRLDESNVTKFMQIINNDARFSNIILSGVNHKSFSDNVPDGANIIKL